MSKSFAYNPILPLDVYIADGEPHVYNERIYLFGSHDQEDGDTFCGRDYVFWSAPIDDLSDWSVSEYVYSSKQDPLYSDDRPYMYAPDSVKGNDGRYYLYYALAGYRGKGGYHGPISVAVSDQPDGPYVYHGFVKDRNGRVFDQGIPFDPALINDEGVIRLYYGTSLPKGLSLHHWVVKCFAKMFANIYGKDVHAFRQKDVPWGAFMLELEDDMLTVKGNARRILPLKTKNTEYEGHAFFEGSSIRKIKDRYVFIYSSEKNHELCYATSPYPDRDFSYGGVILSNGDIGYEGRKKAANTTGTNHGSIVQIKEQWFVFYHRLTHASDYSRQACAEVITIDGQGRISQVGLSSQGLNGKPLPAQGTYPAVMACHISRGKMPHISNQKWKKPIPCIAHDQDDRYVGNITDGTQVVFKSFQRVDGINHLHLKLRGVGRGQLHASTGNKINDEVKVIQIADVNVDQWQTICFDWDVLEQTYDLILMFNGEGLLDLLELNFE